MKILVDIQTGKNLETRLFYRDTDFNESLVEIEETPHLIPSRFIDNKSKDEILKKLNNLRDEFPKDLYYFVKKIDSNILPKNTDQKTIHVFSSPEIKNYLPKEFQKNSPVNNRKKMLRIKKNLFSGTKEEKLESIEKLLRQKVYTFDLEIWNRPEYNKFFSNMYAMTSPFGIEIGGFIMEPHVVRDYKIDLLGQTFTLNLKNFPRTNNLYNPYLGKLSSTHILDEDPFFIVGHNVGTFDSSRLNETKYFLPGVPIDDRPMPLILSELEGSSKPYNRGGGFFKRYEYVGRQCLDSAPFSLKALPFIDNKLETVAKAFFKGFSKITKEEKNDFLTLDIPEDDYQNLEDKIKSGSLDFLLKYGSADVLAHLMIWINENSNGNSLLETVLYQAFLIEDSPSKVCVTSNKRISFENFERNYFKKCNCFPEVGLSEYKDWEDFNLSKLKYDSLNSFKHLKAKRGSGDATLIMLTPYINGLKKYIEKDEFANSYLERIKSSSSLHKFLLAEFMESVYLQKLVYDLEKQKETKSSTMWLSHVYGFKEDMIKNLNKEINKSIKLIDEELKEHLIVNYSDRFVLLDGNIGIESLENQNLAYKFGSGKALSNNKGSFAIKIDDNIVTQGLDIKATKGDRCLLEKKAIDLIYNTFFEQNSTDWVLDYVDDFLFLLDSNDLSDDLFKENLLIMKKSARDYHGFRDNAFFSERVRFLAKNKISEGNDYAYGYEESNSDPVDYQTFMKSQSIPDLRKYNSRFFGNKSLLEGSISKILYSIYCYPRFGELNKIRKHNLQNSIAPEKGYIGEQTSLF